MCDVSDSISVLQHTADCFCKGGYFKVGEISSTTYYWHQQSAKTASTEMKTMHSVKRTVLQKFRETNAVYWQLSSVGQAAFMNFNTTKMVLDERSGNRVPFIASKIFGAVCSSRKKVQHQAGISFECAYMRKIVLERLPNHRITLLARLMNLRLHF